MYESTDKILKRLKIQQKRLFSRNKATMSFDQVNVLARSETMYHDLDEMNKKAYLEIASKVYKEWFPNSDKELGLSWLFAILMAYDPVTKYVYNHEVDRKRSRFAESIIASSTKSKEFITAFNLWWNQTEQYGITVADKAAVQSFKDQGISEVVWNTEKDESVCKICKQRNGSIYPIDKIPSKPHYKCRCYLTPRRKGGN